jgi:hypothetical protein
MSVSDGWSANRVSLEYSVTWPELQLCGVVVFTDHPGHDGSSPNDLQAGEVGHLPGLQCFEVWRSLASGLVRSGTVVMGQVLAEHEGQMGFTRDQYPVQELTAEGSDDAFADGVHPWRLRQGSDDPQPFGFEHLRERSGEERIAIMNQEPQRVGTVAQVAGQIACGVPKRGVSG